MIKKATICTLSMAMAATSFNDAFAARRGRDVKAPVTPAAPVADPAPQALAPPMAKPSQLPAKAPVQSTGLPVVNMVELPISYSVGEQGSAGLAKIQLYYTTNGATWTLYGEDADLTPPIIFKAAKDAEYGFYTVATDKAGNIEPKPQPGSRAHVSVIVDSKNPLVNITEPKNNMVYNAVDVRNIRWSANDLNFPTMPMSIQVSINGGSSWSTLVHNLKNVGSYSWKPDGATYENVKLRIIATDLAGNQGIATSDSFVVDGVAPTTQIKVPTVVGNKTFNVSFDAADQGGAGMASVELWYKLPKQEWKKYAATTDMKKAFKFVSPTEGYVQFAALGVDRVGNAQQTPHLRANIAKEAQTVGIDLTAPEVTLMALNQGGVFQGGSRQTMKWTAKDTNLKDNAITLQFSSDNGVTWRPISENIANAGTFVWTVPNIDTHQAKIKITAVDKMGNARSVESQVPFVIDSTAPESRATFNAAASRPKVKRTVAPAPVPVAPKATVAPSKSAAPQRAVAPKSSAASFAAPKKAAANQVAVPLDRFSEFDKAFAVGNYSSAQALMGHLTNRYPQDAGTWSRHGDLMAQRANHGSAVSSYSRSLSLNPNSSDTLRKRGTSYYQLKQFEKGIADIKAVIKRSGSDAGDFINLGIMSFKHKNIKEAQLYLDKGIQVGGSSALASWYLAKIAESKKDYRSAVSHWEEVIRLSGKGSKFSQYNKSAVQYKSRALKMLQ